MALCGTSSAPEENYVTSVCLKEYSYTWTINSVSTLLENVEGKQISSKFPSGDHEKMKWCLLFYPTSAGDVKFCGFFANLVSSPKDKVNITLELTMTDANGNIIKQETCKHTVYPVPMKSAFGRNDFIERDDLLRLVKPNDKLLMKCKITACVTIINEPQIELSEPLTSSLAKDLKILIDGDKFGDVAILVTGQRFLAYKGILSARSSVFNAMFNHQLQESVDNCVSIDDVAPPVFKELLRYIYTDEVTGLETMADELYKVADKYDIPTLKNLCRYQILAKLSCETSAETLILADLHGDLEMKKYVLQFLSGSVAAANVTKTDGWKEMVRAYPHLVDEVVNALAAKVAISTQK